MPSPLPLLKKILLEKLYSEPSYVDLKKVIFKIG